MKEKLKDSVGQFSFAPSDRIPLSYRRVNQSTSK